MRFSQFILVCLLALLALTCRKKEREGPPLLTTLPVSDIFAIDAECGGTIYYDGNSEITEKGICWSLQPEPTRDNSSTIAGSGSGSFTATVSGLQPSRKYFVRAFATNAFGTSYGNEVSFATTGPPVAPTLSKARVLTLSTSSVLLSSNLVIYPASGRLKEKGFCLSETADPDTSSLRISSSGTVSGSYAMSIPSLKNNTKYYVRAYASTKGGVYYGPVSSFKTYNRTVTDQQGNTYNTLVVDNKEWTVENYRCTKFRDGSDIPMVTDFSSWLGNANGAYCYADNQPANQQKFGNLYNFAAVSNPKGLAPEGWRVATSGDWSGVLAYASDGTASTYFYTSEIYEPSGYWNQLPATNDNAKGLSLRPGGMRLAGGVYQYLFTRAFYWTSTALNATYAEYIEVASTYCSINNTDKRCGAYVRLVRDLP